MKNNAPLLEHGDVDLLWLPMSHIFGFGETCLGNTIGLTSYMVDPQLRVFQQLPLVRPNVFMSVPSLWEKIATTAMGAPTTEARRATSRRPSAAACGSVCRVALGSSAR